MMRLGWNDSPTRQRVARIFLLGVCLWVGATLPLDVVVAGTASPPMQEITQAGLMLGTDATTPPPDSAPWQPVSLPDYWFLRREGASGLAWYRSTFELPEAPQGRQAVFFTRMRSAGEVFVNGQDVGQYGELGKDPEWYPRVQMFDFPPTLVHRGINTLHVHLWVAPGFNGALEPVQVGPRPLILAAYSRANFLRVTVSQWAGLIAGVLGAMMLVIWLRRRHDTMFGWFALTALTKAVYIASTLGATPGIPPWVFVALLSGPMLASLSIYCLRFAGWHWPKAEAAIWVVAIGHGINVAAWNLFDAGLPVGPETLMLLFGAPFALTLLIAWRMPGAESFSLAVAHLLSLALMAVNMYVTASIGIDPELTHSLPVYLVMAWILTRRFVRTLNESEALNADLAARVESKRQELEANYQRLGTLEKEQAVVAERARLMRDMHDGIGGQLISTLSLVESGQASVDSVATALRECIDDLRLAIDSLEPTGDDLVPVLGNLRYRVEPRLQARGIALDWQVGSLPRLQAMTPQNVLHVLRILQEALTNVIKHAGASHVCVATRCDGSRVLIDVRDDGRGWSQGPGGPSGHGLANMRQRAQALGGDLRLQATTSGTTVTLGLPLAAA